MSKFLNAKILFLSLFLCLSVTDSSAADAPPPLLKGTNIAGWLTVTNRQIFKHDALEIKKAGFDFVRLCIEPQFFHYSLDSNTPAAQQIDFKEVDKAISLMNSAGLDVVLDFHPTEEFKKEVEEDKNAEDRFIDFWTRLASHYRHFSGSGLAYQLLNEPQYYKREAQWAELARRLVTAVRSEDKDHLIIISAPRGSSVDGLLTVEPIADPHVAYDFHFYEPYIVTHQGAWWFGDSPVGYLMHVRYPSNLTDRNKIAVTPGENLDKGLAEVDKYMDEGWNESRIDSRIKIAGEWARQHQVRLVNLEFGVLLTRTDPDSRYQWITDVRKALDANHIGWAVFDYTDSFAILKPNGNMIPDPEHHSARWVYPDPESRKIDPAAINALGLHSGK